MKVFIRCLYETDEHVQDNIDDLCEFMTLDGVHNRRHNRYLCIGAFIW